MYYTYYYVDNFRYKCCLTIYAVAGSLAHDVHFGSESHSGCTFSSYQSHIFQNAQICFSHTRMVSNQVPHLHLTKRKRLSGATGCVIVIDHSFPTLNFHHHCNGSFSIPNQLCTWWYTHVGKLHSMLEEELSLEQHSLTLTPSSCIGTYEVCLVLVIAW